MTPEQQAAHQMIKAVYEDKCAEINGREYRFTEMVHKERRSVFTYATSVQRKLESGDLSFMDSPEFERIEGIIEKRVTYNNSMLCRIDGHWDKYPEDYIPFITTAMSVISYPFMRGGPTA